MNDTDDLLTQLRDIQPPGVGIMPAPGWWILVVLGLLLGAVSFYLYRRYQRKGWQREAFLELEQLRSGLGNVPPARTLSQTSTLVRRVALAARPRSDVASVHGEAWLNLLDSIVGKPLFKDGFGRLLETGPYQANPSLGENDLHELLDVVAELINAAEQKVSPRVRS